MKLRSGKIIKKRISENEAAEILLSLKKNYPLNVDKKKLRETISKSIKRNVNIKLI